MRAQRTRKLRPFLLVVPEVSLTAPLIGLTTTRSKNAKGLLQVYVLEAYVQAVAQAGAYPVLIPLGLPEETLMALAARLDGVLFTGGGDVHPRHYAAEGNRLVSLVDDDRDRVEFQLLDLVLAERKPFLGICRGQQVMNLALGGSLYADILEQRPEALQHSYLESHARTYRAHRVAIEGGSRLAGILGEAEAQVNSLHHQAIDRLAPGLRPTAYAPDGIIEAVEFPDQPFGLAVQWHPEWLLDDPAMRALFRAFVQAAEHGSPLPSGEGKG
jgi:putative glutamine amidotransferase